jgi:hypothetical protein
MSQNVTNEMLNATQCMQNNAVAETDTYPTLPSPVNTPETRRHAVENQKM